MDRVWRVRALLKDNIFVAKLEKGAAGDIRPAYFNAPQLWKFPLNQLYPEGNADSVGHLPETRELVQPLRPETIAFGCIFLKAGLTYYEKTGSYTPRKPSKREVTDLENAHRFSTPVFLGYFYLHNWQAFLAMWNKNVSSTTNNEHEDVPVSANIWKLQVAFETPRYREYLQALLPNSHQDPKR